MYLDILIAVILIFAVIEGLKDGFLLQFFSIFGIFIDFIIAQKLTPVVMEKLTINNNEGNFLLTYIGVFIASYFVIAILMFFIGIILKNQNRGFLSRGLGGVFGLVKGLVVSIIILFIFNYAAQKYTALKKYGTESKANEVFLEKSYYLEEYLPKELKSELDYIKGKELVEKYFNKMF
ncbi:CvpA family protein [Candidatus Cetobacterium colombiensis]|uniref:CvpA family protein n=1 Tax=Candidatus Cetobacterium colombiensis TaxID=3073100 RepID=A0ABU4W9X8_9FUSO|nr:CvpA family protein [Candidatus Cetobacterium colombiensis]MDX8336342.1 CvpA family protein [Candidatus Cetobacterium colombiensis]